MESASVIAPVFAQLGLSLIERGWLSSNNLLFGATRHTPPTLIDSGYVSHAAQTLELLGRVLASAPVERIVNTHLHSDHVGGNALLQRRWDSEVCIHEASFDAAACWDEWRLSYLDTGQSCPRFRPDIGLRAGDSIMLGAYRWTLVPAGGHDPHTLMLFQPDSAVLISGDALWEERVAIVFPSLDGDDTGYLDALAALESIERLAPRIVIPGHGRAFTDVAGAVARSRQRLEAFRRLPARHASYAERALLMFHMLEHRQRRLADVIAWLKQTPIFGRIVRRNGLPPSDDDARRVIEALLSGGQLRLLGEVLSVR
ncbi:MBL fold metallo-hydrolase [Rubrivivax sp. JA1024]|nr:MBL fold metallo-hydrolase [Rubrivivax sp. JA1024]